MHTLASLTALITQRPNHQELLDQMIHNELSREATSINNMGATVQLEELLSRGWLSTEILKEIKSMHIDPAE